jgi:hypothetical protein
MILMNLIMRWSVNVGDLVQSSAFQNLYGIIVETDVIQNYPENEDWFLVYWFLTDKSSVPLGLRRNGREWVRPWEIEVRDIP